MVLKILPKLNIFLIINVWFFLGLKSCVALLMCFSRRWGSLWSACCGSSTVSFTEGEGIMEWSPSNGLTALASQGGVGNSSRPQGHSAVTTHSPQLPPDCRTNAIKPQGKGENVVSRPLQTVVLTTVQFRGGGGVGGSVYSPAESQLYLFTEGYNGVLGGVQFPWSFTQGCFPLSWSFHSNRKKNPLVNSLDYNSSPPSG